MLRKLMLLLLTLTLLLALLPPVAAQEPSVTTTANLRVRSAPTTSAPRLQTIPRGTAVPVYGRNADTSWLQVGYRGVIGWISVFYVNTNISLGSLPIVDATVPNPERRQEQVTAPDGTAVRTGQLIVFSTAGRVNVRATNNDEAAILTQIPVGARVAVTSVDRSLAWGLVTYNGITGWVALWVVTQLGDIRTVPIYGVPGSGSVVPITTSPYFDAVQREAVARAQRHLNTHIGGVSSLIDILNQGANGGIITCGPAMNFFEAYSPSRFDYELVPELFQIVQDMNAAFNIANSARAQWLSRCAATGNTVLTRDGFAGWLATANIAGAQLGSVQQRLAALSAR